MALFPSIAGTNTTSITATETTSAVNLPASISAGQLLLVFCRCPVAGAIGWPAGWNELFENSSDASDDITALAWRKADGGEGATISVTHGSGKFAALSWKIDNARDPTVQAPEFSTVVTGTSTGPDPGTVTPTGGAKDYLWLALVACEGEQSLTPTYPANYTLSQLGQGSGTGGAVTTNVRVYGAKRTDVNAASENPGAFTISVSDDWSAWAVAVHPNVFTGTASFTLTGITSAASGVHGVAGTAAGTVVGITGSAVGEHPLPVEGTGAGTVAPSASAVGAHGATGTAVGASAPTAAATGDQVATGTAAGTLAPLSSAAGDHGVAGTAAGSCAATGSAAGEHDGEPAGGGSGLAPMRRRRTIYLPPPPVVGHARGQVAFAARARGSVRHVQITGTASAALIGSMRARAYGAFGVRAAAVGALSVWGNAKGVAMPENDDEELILLLDD